MEGSHQSCVQTEKIGHLRSRLRHGGGLMQRCKREMRALQTVMLLEERDKPRISLAYSNTFRVFIIQRSVQQVLTEIYRIYPITLTSCRRIRKEETHSSQPQSLSSQELRSIVIVLLCSLPQPRTYCGHIVGIQLKFVLQN